MAVVAALITLLAVYGVYSREKGQSASLDSPTAPGGLFQESQARGTSLVAVGKVEGLPLPCTAWLLDTGAAPEAPALAVTAGRCVGIDDATTIVTELPVSGASVEFNTFASLTTAVSVEPVPADVEAVAWASMGASDVAVLRLGATYGELAARGVQPIDPVATPGQGGQILVAGVPVEGIGADQQDLRGSRCEIGATTDLAESPWVWHAMRATGCDGILEGSAGSPAFNPDGAAVGMVTTTTIAAEPGPDCSLGRPCEVREGTVAVEPDRTYLVQVAGIERCFPDGRFRAAEGCPLPDPRGVVEASVAASAVPAGSPVEVRIAGTPPSTVSVKGGMLGEVDCWDADGWAPAEVDEDGIVLVTAPARQGLALLCVGSADQPTPIMVTVVGSAPAASGIVLEQVPVEGGVQVQPVAAPPQYSTFRWVSGPTGSIDCATAEGYARYTGEPAVIEAGDMPVTVCVIAYDEAGNPSAPTGFEVT